METHISIVTPSYNQGDFIAETIQSVISQEGDFFLEYLVIDGGSTDQTIEIIKYFENLIQGSGWSWRCRGITFRWVSERDLGQSHAINKGLMTATGDILGWINSDDLYFPGALQRVTEYFRRNPQDDFVFGDGDVIDEKGNLQWEWLARPYNLRVLKSYHRLWNDFTNYIMQQATFWRRGVLRRIGLLDESFHYAMDVEYWIRAGQAGLVFTHLPVKLGKFRMIKGTKSLSSALVFWPDMLEIFRRYNGAASMRPFFALFFYNVGLHHRCDLTVMRQYRERVLGRWQYLPAAEYELLKVNSKMGLYRACLMLANTSYDLGDGLQGKALFQYAVGARPPLRIHPLSLLIALKRLLGRRMSAALKKIRDRLVMRYRRERYLYRYKCHTAEGTGR
ncbi:MAG TPA: glycosyltransferase family 2 protein [Candidatus Tectomicrobia bacterium]|nr:glycosyltransferase family 2 protein [Candidatus Tectomicrobia bacterium]